MSKLEDFFSRLNPWVPGCPEPVARQALLDSAIGFCEDTNIIQYFSDPAPLAAGKASYDIDLPTMTDLARVHRVWIDEEMIPSASPNMIYDLSAYTGSRGGSPGWSCVVERNVLTLVPTPTERDAGKKLRTLAATKPARNATTVDDALFNDWAEVIVAGAVFRLAATPGTSYTSTDTAITAAASYARGCSQAKIERGHGRTVSSSAVISRNFRGVR